MGEAGPAGPMVDMVLFADDSVVPSAAQPQEVTALLQQVLTSNQVIVASNQAIADRITALEMAKRQPHPQGMKHLPISDQPDGVALETVHLLRWGFPNPVGRQPPARPSRQTFGWRPICGGPWLVPNASGARDLQRGGGSVARPPTQHAQADCWRLRGLHMTTAGPLRIRRRQFLPPGPGRRHPAHHASGGAFSHFHRHVMAVLEYGIGIAQSSAIYASRACENPWRRYWGPCRSGYNSTLRASQRTQSKLASSSFELQTTASTRACTRSPCKRSNGGGRTHTGRLPPAPGKMRRTLSS